jgi:antitoxin component of MazEF toxin-antitoxin module
MLRIAERKVQSLGPKGALAVILPKLWTNNFGIQKGDRLVVDLLDDGSLKVSQMEAA